MLILYKCKTLGVFVALYSIYIKKKGKSVTFLSYFQKMPLLRICYEIFTQYGGNIAQNALCHVGLVHGVHVHVGNPVGVQVYDLVAGIDDACLLHGLGVGPELVHQGLEALGHKGTRKLDGPLHLVGVGDGHDAGEYGAGDACFPEFVHEVQEQVVVEYHLGGKEVCACVHLFFKVLDVFGLVGAFGVLFGVAGRPDAKVRVCGLEFADEFHGVVVVAVVPALLDEFRGQVAPQGHHVLDASRLHVGNALVDRVLAARDAGKVRQHGDVVFFLQVFRDVQGEVAHAAARAIGDAHKGRGEGCDGFRCRLDALEAGFLFRREHLEGEAHLVLLQDVDNLHVDLAVFKLSHGPGGRTATAGLCRYFNTCINIAKGSLSVECVGENSYI